MPSWGLIAHGGAKDVAPDEDKANRAGLTEAIKAGSEMLEHGATALDTVEAVVMLLENNPAYNAGLYGSVRNEEGEIELTASIMDGATLDIGAVAGMRNIQHPVSIARALLADRAIFLIGEGAMKFATAHGFEKRLPPQDVTSQPTKAAAGCDTVGCVARDHKGNLAAATSTGGLQGTRLGRVGDVPLPGCGFYADNRRGAVSASGEGEAIARVMLSSEFLHFLNDMPPQQAAEKALALLDQVQGEAGLIAIMPDGTLAWAHNSPHFAVGMQVAGGPIHIYLQKEEENG